jgi:hypothetical protein
MRLIDQQFLRTPFYGSRRMTVYLERAGETVNRKRVQRLMAVMGLEALFPKPRTTTPAPGARVYPNLLRDPVLTHADEVWSSDITYVPMRHGFMYLTAVIDWYSRYVLWRGVDRPVVIGAGEGRALLPVARCPARPASLEGVVDHRAALGATPHRIASSSARR